MSTITTTANINFAPDNNTVLVHIFSPDELERRRLERAAAEEERKIAAEQTAYARLLTLLTPPEREKMLRDGYVWVDGKLNQGRGWEDHPYKFLIPGFELRWAHSLLYSEICMSSSKTEMRFAQCCIQSSFPLNLPKMDRWISVYLHVKSLAFNQLVPTYAALISLHDTCKWEIR